MDEKELMSTAVYLLFATDSPVSHTHTNPDARPEALTHERDTGVQTLTGKYKVVEGLLGSKYINIKG